MPYIRICESQDAIPMVQTVRKNFEGFTNNQVGEAILARKVQAMIVHPTETNFKPMLRKKLLRNLPAKAKYFTNILSIVGPDLEVLKG